jgi:hypothetical protein
MWNGPLPATSTTHIGLVARSTSASETLIFR